MRILSVGAMYPPQHQGGYEVVWQASVRHMRAQGHEVRVLATSLQLRDAPDAPGEDADVHRELAFHVHGASPAAGRKALLARERHNARVFDRHLAEVEPDLVMWWHMLGVSLGLLERARRARVPALGVVHDEWPVYGPEHDGWGAALATLPPGAGHLAERVLGLPRCAEPLRSGAWSFNSRWLRDEVVGKVAPGGELRLSVASPGIRAADFPEAPPNPWRGRLAYVGRIDRRKGIHLAVEALATLPECSLDVVGGGDTRYLAELRDRAAELDVADRVRFLDPLHHRDLGAAYAGYDAIVFPVTWQEPWGLVPLEAMSVGVPVVATGTGGSAEYLDDGANSLLVPTHDSRALANAVRRLAGDDALRARLRAGGLQTAREHDDRSFQEALLREAEAVTGAV